jgi:hypothetical protein
MTYSARNFKQLAHDLIDKLPDDATWPDLIDRAAERQDLFEAAESNDYDDGTGEPDLREYDRLPVERGWDEGEAILPY